MRTITLATALSTLLLAAAALVFVLAYDGAEAGIPMPPVNSTDDPGIGVCDVTECTLREAITLANANPGSTITFNIPGCPASCTINVVSDMTEVSGSGTVIDGTTEPDYTNTPIIIIDGNTLSSGESGLYLWADNITVRGLIVQNFPAMGMHSANLAWEGITIEENIIRDNGTYGIGLTGGDHVISGNVIEDNGSDGVGAAFAGAGTGLLVEGNQVSDNAGNGIRSSIVNSTFIDNIVAGNDGRGIDAGDGDIVATGNVVTDSGSIGLFASGDTSLVTGNTATGNGETGIVVGGGLGTVTDNVSNNNGFAFLAAVGPAGIDPGDGFEIGGSSVDKVVTGNTASGNARHGIAVFSGANTIGGASAQDGNVSANNGGAGVYVFDSDATGNSILRNSIYDNDGLGIDLDPLGVTSNDDLDSDIGANNRQNFPVLVTAVSGSVAVTGDLHSVPLTEFRVEFFHNDACDSSGFGEGKTYLGALNVTTDASGDTPFDTQFGVAPSVGFVTATATRQDTGDTSEFSNCLAIESPATPTPTPSPEPSETSIPTATATPTPTPGPSGSATPMETATGSETPSSTASPLGELWGDVDCSGAVDPVDSLKLLRHDAGLSVTQADDCPPVGEPVDLGDTEEQWGDVDCSESVDPVDSLKVLRHDAGLSVAQEPDCPAVGNQV